MVTMESHEKPCDQELWERFEKEARQRPPAWYVPASADAKGLDVSTAMAGRAHVTVLAGGKF